MGLLRCAFFLLAIMAKTQATTQNDTLSHRYLLSQHLNQFTFDMQKNVCGDKTGNVVFSPFSVYSALAMLYVGAREKSRSQIKEAMMNGNSKSSDETFLKSLQYLAKNLKSNQDVTLQSAMNAWIDLEFVLSKFKEEMEQYFGVEVQKLNFRKDSESARKQINKWVSDKTGDRIPELFPAGAINEMTKLVLANAVYFKGKWKDPFEKSLTSMRKFYVTENTGDDNGDMNNNNNNDDHSGGLPVPPCNKNNNNNNIAPRQIPFMYRSDDYNCGHYRNVDLLEIPYGSEGEFTMLLAKPRGRSHRTDSNNILDVDALTNQMDASLMKNFFKSMFVQEADIHVPKFTVEMSFDLAEQLKKLGVTDVFKPGVADLSFISGLKNLHVSSARHQAFLKVDEEGTEAAAATGIGISVLSLHQSLKIRFDRPFLFYILHKPDNAVVFAGRVVDPQIIRPQ